MACVCENGRGESAYLESWVSFFQKRVELPLRPLLRAESNQHRKIHLAQVMFFAARRGPALRQDNIVHKKRRAWVALF